MNRPTSPQEALNNVREWFANPDRELALRFNEPEDNLNVVYTPKVSCFYRHPNDPEGCRCAIGCQLPDDLYEPRFDDRNERTMGGDTSFEQVAEVAPAVSDYFSEVNADFLRDLQSAHDTARDRGTLNANLSQLAEEWRLTYDAIPF